MNRLPEFTIDQTPKAIVLVITLPYVQPEQAEMFVDEKTFIFSLEPYYLRLDFSQDLIGDNKVEVADYDKETHKMTIEILKKEEGTEFSDLKNFENLENEKLDLGDLEDRIRGMIDDAKE